MDQLIPKESLRINALEVEISDSARTLIVEARFNFGDEETYAVRMSPEDAQAFGNVLFTAGAIQIKKRSKREKKGKK